MQLRSPSFGTPRLVRLPSRRLRFRLSATFEFYNVEQKKVAKESRPRSAQRPVVVVQLTVRESVGQSCGHAFFSQVHEASGAPSRGTAVLGSPGTAEQRHQRDRMRHGRARTMRQQRLRMPLPQVTGADARQAAPQYLSFPEKRAAASARDALGANAPMGLTLRPWATLPAAAPIFTLVSSASDLA